MKKMIPILIIALLIAVSAGGCADAPQNAPARQTASPEQPAETYIFTDSAGREVELLRNIERIVPSGPLAQIVLYTLCPDKLVGLYTDLGVEQLVFMDNRLAGLPVLGGYSQGTLNLEALMATDAQLYIDIGEPSSNAAEEIEMVQNDTGIKAIFVQMDNLESMITAYDTLGAVLGAGEQAARLVEFIGRTISDVADVAAMINPDERVNVYYGYDDGLTAIVDQTVHSDVIDMVNAVNVSKVESTLRGGAAEVSMEQLILWQPDVVLLAPGSIYDDIAERAEWSAINAISEGMYFEAPEWPYNWMGRPPSVNRVMGVWWLANLLYPDTFQYDVAEVTREFYNLFYHCDLTDAQINEILAKSTYK